MCRGFVDLAILAATRAATQLQAPAPAASSSSPPLATSTLLSSVALHSLRATCLTLQKLLLLLGYISHIGSLGSAPLTAADHAATAADLITPLSTALRSAAEALWLCKTPASAAVPGLLTKLQGPTGLYNDAGTICCCACMHHPWFAPCMLPTYLRTCMCHTLVFGQASAYDGGQRWPY